MPAKSNAIVPGISAGEIDQTKDVYHSLQEKLEYLFDSLAREKINLELQMIEAKKFKLAVDSASDNIVITDSMGTIFYVNKATEKNTGYTFNESVGKNPGKLWGGKMTKEYYADMWNVIKTRKEVFVGQFNNVRKNGEKYIAAVDISSVLDEQGEILFFVSIERDITREAMIEQMKDEFVGLASHQLRTPLTGIKWFSELLIRNKYQNLNAEQLDFLEQIRSSNQRMIKLVNELLDISHIETGQKFEIKKADFKINDVIKEALADDISLIKTKSLNIVNEIPDDLLIFADYVKIKQVMSNLINNATKYTPSGKAVQIKAVTDKAKGWVVISVTDQGMGIPALQKSRLFEKFFRADNARIQEPNGTGLGLYIARELIRAHGGEMWFESEENKETTFYFSIPLKIN
ncbi:MAG: ATP-binding protein [Patescibacteria group bacterium]|jgi:PAS domain S-box-containing protein